MCDDEYVEYVQGSGSFEPLEAVGWWKKVRK
jgi:hypothetical protein